MANIKKQQTVKKHTIESANQVLKDKKLQYLTAISIDSKKNILVLLDEKYGKYQVHLQSLCASMSVPLHKMRKHTQKLIEIKTKLLGTEINNRIIIDVFYGQDKGYKTRSFFVVFRCNKCGTEMESPIAGLKHRKTLLCQQCAKIIHGERILVNGVRKKRTATYSHWQRCYKNLPNKYHNFETFRNEIGEKPYKSATIDFLNDRLIWKNNKVLTIDDADLNMIATAIRQAFRRSYIYLEAIAKARVETVLGIRYICDACGGLFKLKEIQVDHINPIMPVDGSPLKKEELIDRIWTTDIQILDKKCHNEKSQKENEERRQIKKTIKNKIVVNIEPKEVTKKKRKKNG
jgi:hypothetical protein